MVHSQRRRIVVAATLAVFLPSAAAFAAEPPITALAFAPDGKSLLAGAQSGIVQLSWPELKRAGSIKTDLAHVHDLTFSPRGDLLAAAGGSPADVGAVEVFSWPEGKLKYRVEPHSDLVYCVAWSPDGDRLATASYDHTVRILDAAAGKTVRKLEGHSRGVLAVCWLPDGKALVSGGADNSLRVWDAGSGRLLRSLENHTAAVHALALQPPQPDGSLPVVASASDDRTVRLWQPTLGRMMRFVRMPSAPLAIAWSLDGKKLAAACVDGRVRVIDAATLETMADVAAIDGRAHCLAAEPSDGKQWVVGGADGQAKAIDIPRSK